MWALRTLRKIVNSDVGLNLNIKSLLFASYSGGQINANSPPSTPPCGSSQSSPYKSTLSLPVNIGTSSSSCRTSSESLESLPTAIILKGQEKPVSELPLVNLLKGLPEALLRQYDYEDPLVRGGKHLMHSQFFKVNDAF